MSSMSASSDISRLSSIVESKPQPIPKDVVDDESQVELQKAPPDTELSDHQVGMINSPSLPVQQVVEQLQSESPVQSEIDSGDPLGGDLSHHSVRRGSQPDKSPNVVKNESLTGDFKSGWLKEKGICDKTVVKRKDDSDLTAGDVMDTIYEESDGSISRPQMHRYINLGQRIAGALADPNGFRDGMLIVKGSDGKKHEIAPNEDTAKALAWYLKAKAVVEKADRLDHGSMPDVNQPHTFPDPGERLFEFFALSKGLDPETTTELKLDFPGMPVPNGDSMVVRKLPPAPLSPPMHNARLEIGVEAPSEVEEEEDEEEDISVMSGLPPQPQYQPLGIQPHDEEMPVIKVGSKHGSQSVDGGDEQEELDELMEDDEVGDLDHLDHESEKEPMDPLDPPQPLSSQKVQGSEDE